MNERAIRLRVADPDLTRSRLTVAFRFILAIPHFIWAAIWFSLASLAAIANWIATLISGAPSPMLHRFLSAYVRYISHLVAYMTFAANPYPPFTGQPGRYPIDIDIDEPGRQNRWVTGFRLVLAIPAIMLADTMLGFGTSAVGGSNTTSGGIAGTVAFLGWFACLARARMPQGMRDLAAYAIGYSAQAIGYVFLLTDRYPNSDPAVYESANTFRSDPIRVNVDDDLRRSRLTVFFRILLAIPHLVWLVLWTIPALFAWIATYFVTLIRARPPAALHRFLTAYLRYQIHVYAFIQLVANPFPGFGGRAGSYPIDAEVAGPERQNRWITGFRGLLAIPALLIWAAISGAATVAAILGWFYALVLGRMPRGLRNLGAFELRYYAQLAGYWYFLTDSYPYSGPSAGWQLSLTPAAPQQI